VIATSDQFQRDFRLVLLRSVVALSVAVAVTAISLYAAWLNGRDASPARVEQSKTQWQLRAIDRGVTLYQARSNQLPASMDQLLASSDEIPVFGLGKEGELLDGWQRPFLFTRQGTNVMVTSWGRDGKPGGEGLDCDLSNKDWRPANSLPAFAQFLWKMPKVRGMIISCLLCGLLALVVAFASVKVPHFTRHGLSALAIRIVATTISALVVAWFISALHIPSGH